MDLTIQPQILLRVDKTVSKKPSSNRMARCCLFMDSTMMLPNCSCSLMRSEIKSLYSEDTDLLLSIKNIFLSFVFIPSSFAARHSLYRLRWPSTLAFDKLDHLRVIIVPKDRLFAIVHDEDLPAVIALDQVNSIPGDSRQGRDNAKPSKVEDTTPVDVRDDKVPCQHYQDQDYRSD